MGKKINDLTGATPALTDKIEISQSPHGAGTSKSTTLQEVKDLISDVKVVTAYWNSTIILALNSTPQALATPASGKFIHIEDVIIECDAGTPYATNTTLRFGNPSAAKPQFENNTLLMSTAGRKVKATQVVSDSPLALADGQYEIDDTLSAWVATGDPTAGDFNVAVTVYYREITPQV